MAKIQFNCRLSEETQALINGEVDRLTAETGKKVSRADVVELAVVKWCSVDSPESFVELAKRTVNQVSVGHPNLLMGERRALAETAIRNAESKPVEMQPKVSGRAESVAQKRARETREHAASLAESDTSARLMGRDDIEYDLEDVRHRQTGVGVLPKSTERHHYPVANRKVAPITRPHGHIDSKKRHAEGKS